MILLGARKRSGVRRGLLVILGFASVAAVTGAPAWRAARDRALPPGAGSWTSLFGFGGSDVAVQRVIDDAKVLPPGVREKAETYARQIHAESDVDFRLAFLRTASGESLEILAPELMNEIGAGASTSGERGLLVVWDATSGRGRIEVGYGLEEHFPDGLVGYLLANHVDTLFAAGDPEQAIHLLLRMLHHRVREAVLDQRFDPSVLEVLARDGHLSGGAGAARTMPLAEAGRPRAHPQIAAASRARFAPQPTPEDAYRAYLDWLAAGTFDPTIELLTPETRAHLARFPMTPGYLDYILLQEYGQQYTLLTRGDLAMLVFASTPLASPHFFRRGPDGWQLDILAEIANTANISGGIYTWTYRGQDDPYTNRFADELIKIGNYMRLVHGDNRVLPLRDPDHDPSTGLVAGARGGGAG